MPFPPPLWSIVLFLYQRLSIIEILRHHHCYYKNMFFRIFIYFIFIYYNRLAYYIFVVHMPLVKYFCLLEFVAKNNWYIDSSAFFYHAELVSLKIHKGFNLLSLNTEIRLNYVLYFLFKKGLVMNSKKLKYLLSGQAWHFKFPF